MIPLLDVFEALREQQFPLGVDDLLEISDLVRSGLVPASRPELVSACQTLWAKSPEEAALIEDFLFRFLPPVFTPDDLERLDQEALRRDTEAAPGAPTTGATRDATDQALQPRSEGPRSRLPDYRYGAVTSGHAIQLPSGKTLEVDPKIDLTGHFPVTRRQMKRAWRHFRRMRREGPPTEFNLESTVEQLHRDGVIERLVFVPRRTNTARLLILQDVGGSMVPFRRVADALAETGSVAGLTRFEVAFFHDVPGGVSYRNGSLTDPVGLAVLLAPFKDRGILIVSDGGAARGRLEARRISRTITGISSIRQFTPNIAWLNPVPSQRWPGSSAAAIASEALVPMFPFDRGGLNRAVDVLRGIIAT